ncbi:2'-5' RNA ligase family protein [Sorangium sp. So ce1128]
MDGVRAGRLGDRLIDEGVYVSALVLGMPVAVAELVQSLRRTIPIQAPPEHQLDPHLTVLYLGIMPSPQLELLRRSLLALRPVGLDVNLGGIGTFAAAGRITNVHLRVEECAAIRELHWRALDICRAHAWPPQTPYAGNGYVPHVTILDCIDVPAADFMPPPVSALLPVHAWLDDLHLIGRRVDGCRPGG